jgi:hypothetical protein
MKVKEELLGLWKRKETVRERVREDKHCQSNVLYMCVYKCTMYMFCICVYTRVWRQQNESNYFLQLHMLIKKEN